MADWVLAFSTLIGAVVYLRATLNIPQLAVGDVVGPRFFPSLVGIGLLISAMLLIYETWRKRAAVAGVAPQPPQGDSKKPQKILVGMAVWTLIYYTAFEPIGYIASTIIYMFVIAHRWLPEVRSATN